MEPERKGAITARPDCERPRFGTTPADGAAHCRRARPPMARTFVAIIVTAAVALLAGACGRSPGSHVAQLGSTTTQSSSSLEPSAASGQRSAVAFASCMRSNGVPGWPGPNRYGGFDKSKLTQEQLGADSSKVRTAQRTCQHLLPTSSASQEQTQRIVAQALRFSRCMRNHGIASFPDPDSNGGIRIPRSLQDNGGPHYEAALKACQPFPPPPLVTPRSG
jgi:hypothetical protein